MSNIVATNEAPAARATNVALWVLQAVLAFQFAAGGLLKLTGSPELVDLFATIGAGQWLRYLVGTLEVAGAVGLLVRGCRAWPRSGWPGCWWARPPPTCSSSARARGCRSACCW